MKNIKVIYDTGFGNTKLVAERIAKTLGCKAESVNDFNVKDINGIEMLIIGAPTYGGQAKPEMKNWLSSIPEGCLKGVKAASFDTRVKAEDMNKWLKFLINLIGYASPKINTLLKNKGAEIVAKPVGFFVKEKEGPLYGGELERAEKWGKEVILKY